jgi:hypothetical protein
MRSAGKRDDIWVVMTVSPLLTWALLGMFRSVTKRGLAPSQSMVPVSLPCYYLQHQKKYKIEMPSDEEKNVTHLIGSWFL